MKSAGKTIFILLFLVLFSLLIVGCSQTIPSSPSEISSQIPSTDTEKEINSSKSVSLNYPESYLITSKNRFDYQPGLECSAFSSAYLLRHFGEEADGLELFKDYPGKLSGGTGVYPSGVEQFCNNRQGYVAEFKTEGTIEELKQLISTGVPVIVFIHVEEPYTSPHNTHYLPLIGYDSEYFYFAESLEYLANCKDEPNLNYNRKTEISKFERLWSNIDATWDNPYFVITKENE